MYPTTFHIFIENTGKCAFCSSSQATYAWKKSPHNFMNWKRTIATDAFKTLGFFNKSRFSVISSWLVEKPYLVRFICGNGMWCVSFDIYRTWTNAIDCNCIIWLLSTGVQTFDHHNQQHMTTMDNSKRILTTLGAIWRCCCFLSHNHREKQRKETWTS